MAIFPSTAIPSAADDFTIPYSCRFEDGSSAYLSRTPAGASNRKTWTFSCWLKRGNLGVNMDIFHAYVSGDRSQLFIASDDTLKFDFDDSTANRLVTTQLFRDPSAWYHIVVAVDTEQGVAANRVKIYVNGTQVTDFSTTGYPTEDEEGHINEAIQHEISSYDGSGYFIDGYLAEVHFIDGTQLTPSSFGESGDYGEWKAKKVAGLTYGTNGFYLDFSDSAALGDDAAGSNDWTVNALTATDQMLDSPTNNFCTLNPLAGNIAGAGFFEEGNLGFDGDASLSSLLGTIGVTSGKWYYEYHEDVVSTSAYHNVGFANTEFPNESSMSDMITNEDTWGMGLPNGSEKWNGEGYWNGTSWGSWTQSDTLGLAIDVDAGKVWFSVLGTWISSGDPAAGTGEAFSGLPAGTYSPCATIQNHAIGRFNFGADSSFEGNLTAQGNQDGNGIGDFQYTPPTGFLALCTSNLPAVAVVPSEHFNAILYDDGAGAKTGVGFQPDLVWLKSRGSGYEHELVDAVRGVTKALSVDSGNIESTDSTGLTAFGADGFTVGADTNYADTTGDGMVAWNWKANGAGSANTDGNMAEAVTVSANVDAGFSIVTYTGDGAVATVGHGLSKAPELIIIKNRDATDTWRVYHHKNTSAPETDYLDISANSATTDTAENWNDTAPTSSVFTIGDGAAVNTDNNDYIAYCFHSVEGYSKFGTYTGRAGGGTTGYSYIYTGFRPAWFIIKESDSTSSWTMLDNIRDQTGAGLGTYNYNPVEEYFTAHDDDAEANYRHADFVSNGFKLRGTGGDFNGSGDIYVYMAFAETPFKYSNAR